MPLCLGKLAPKHNAKTLLFSKYLVDAPPEKVYWEYKVPDDAWQMFGNDSIGDCTCAAIAHMLMLMTAHTGPIVIPTITDVISAYSAVSGYNPSTGENDNGAAITDVLNYWKTVGIAGRKIDGWAQLNQANLQHVEQGVYLFSAIDIGVNFPNSAMQQFNAGQPFEVLADDGGIDGGHSVPNFGYGSEGQTCVTWAKRQQMSAQWFQKYCDEAYVVLTKDWIDAARDIAPNNLDYAALVADLAAIAE